MKNLTALKNYPAILAPGPARLEEAVREQIALLFSLLS